MNDCNSKAAGQVIWIDEAGQVGTQTMAKIFALAERLDARVLLSGDRRQHGSVERGTALQLLEEEAGLVPAEVKEIQRQKGDYKEAVHALAKGGPAKDFSGSTIWAGSARCRMTTVTASSPPITWRPSRTGKPPWSFRRRMPKGTVSPLKSATPYATRRATAASPSWAAMSERLCNWRIRI